MESKCELSRLIIPADTGYAAIAGSYAAGVAGRFGFDPDECDLVERGVSRAVSGIIEYSFRPGEAATVEIECERAPAGLRVSIRDQGLPLDPARVEQGQCPTDRPSGQPVGICIDEYMDEVRFRNLGRAGKETILVKYLRNRSLRDYYDACELEPYPLPILRKTEQGTGPECTIRLMVPADAIEVSKCIYRAYGYSYGYELLYHPERLVELNESGRILSAVAMVDHEIAGHCALLSWDPDSRIVEIGQGAVKPEFRGRGCFTKLTAYLLEQARARGYLGVYGQAVTLHTYSQQVAHSFGMRDSALIMAFLPQSVTFKDMSTQLTQRGSLLTHFMYLAEPPVTEIYAPERHADMIRRLYLNMGVSPMLRTPDPSSADGAEEPSRLNVLSLSTLNSAFIDIEHAGPDVTDEVRTRLRDLRIRRIDAITLHLDLSEPSTFFLTQEFEKMGFFFAGVLPGKSKKGDALILQYLNNVLIDYDAIRLASDMANELKAYIRSHDPNHADKP